PKTPAPTPASSMPTISIKDFQKLDLRVGRVLQAERLQGSDKLLLLKVDFGDRTRTILSGIAKHYQPQDLEGKQVCAVLNLEPRKMLGVVSEGMILSAQDQEGLHLIAPCSAVKEGSSIS
ncbi:methionine--tRNA ligase subunit beta, partial [Helicobacter felis]|uniref:methionine--tRNA ligase subunit beta n=1 Tax=Helicobacter felis TaxID=214 RepID=UPI001F324024